MGFWHFGMIIMYALTCALGASTCYVMTLAVFGIFIVIGSVIGLFLNLFIFVLGSFGDVGCELHKGFDNLYDGYGWDDRSGFERNGIYFNDVEECTDTLKTYHIIKFLIDLICTIAMIFFVVKTFQWHKTLTKQFKQGKKKETEVVVVPPVAQQQ